MESLGFKEWLRVQEASTDYLRNPGTRQVVMNPFMRAALNTTPYHIQAIDRGGGALSDLFSKSMYKTTDAPVPYVGYGGSYEGYHNEGLTITVMIGSEEAEGDPVKAKYLALKRAIDQVRNTGREGEFDIRNAMVSKAIFLRPTPQGDVYPVEVLFPFAGYELERQRDKEFAADVLASRRDLPDILSGMQQVRPVMSMNPSGAPSGTGGGTAGATA